MALSKKNIRLWRHVTEGITSQNIEKSSFHKNAIEQNQRDLLKERQEAGKDWTPRFFEHDGFHWKLK